MFWTYYFNELYLTLTSFKFVIYNVYFIEYAKVGNYIYTKWRAMRQYKGTIERMAWHTLAAKVRRLEGDGGSKCHGHKRWNKRNGTKLIASTVKKLSTSQSTALISKWIPVSIDFYAATKTQTLGSDTAAPSML